MLKKLIFVFIFFLLSSFFLVLTPHLAFAASEFSTSYDVKYDVDSSGMTTVTENINLTNLTDNYYASEFSLSISSTKITNVSASDNNGPLQATLSQEGNRSKVDVKFGSQIAGKDKEYNFTLKFESPDFAQAQGKVWQVSIPKIASTEGLDSYSLTLSVPEEFGDPTSILPEPEDTTQSNGKINLIFDKSQLTDAGILANFGTNQLFSYTLKYHLTNTGVLPSIAKLPLPPDTEFQQVQINSVSPKPETVTIDSDGNYIGWFKVSPHQSLDASISGLVKLSLNSRQKLPFLLSKQTQQELTSSQQYWDTENPLIQNKLAEIFKSGKPSSVKEQARLINNFVVNTLKYDTNKLSSDNFQRLGAITILNNPDQALCSEFTDLFITLARADGIPARELDGYAYTPNTDIRPLSFNGTILHAWPEYYDPQVGWIMIDPTWQNTTGGVDYFSKFDLNHFVLDIRGQSSTDPTTAGDVKVDFSGAEFNPHPQLSVNIDSPKEIFAGFPASAIVNIVNSGTSLSPTTTLTLNSQAIKVTGLSSYDIPTIPPYGTASYKFDLRTRSLLDSFDEGMQVSIAGKTVTQKVKVRPFFAFSFFPVVLVVLTAIMVLLYLSALGVHFKTVKKSSNKKGS